MLVYVAASNEMMVSEQIFQILQDSAEISKIKPNSIKLVYWQAKSNY